MAAKYHFELNDQFLTPEEQEEFRDFLKVHDLEANIWGVFVSLFRSGVKNGKPLLLRVYNKDELIGAVILTRCSGYGKALFGNKGGEYIRVEGKLSEQQLVDLKRCFISTAENSVFYLPYQDLYLNAALTTSSTHIENVHYFIAMLDGEIIGYQAAIKTGKYLNALHGAFDRNLKTTYHAYDILYVKMTEFAIEHGLEICDFGAVLNYTKQKMVNRAIDMSYFLVGKYPAVQNIFSWFLKQTRIQGTEQLKFNMEK